MVIEASLWRDERKQKHDLMQAWSVAALSRAKRLPSLKQLLAAKPARPLKGRELVKRRREFANMTAGLKGLDLGKLMKRKKENTDG